MFGDDGPRTTGLPACARGAASSNSMAAKVPVPGWDLQWQTEQAKPQEANSWGWQSFSISPDRSLPSEIGFADPE